MPAGLHFVLKYFSFTLPYTLLTVTLVYIDTIYQVPFMRHNRVRLYFQKELNLWISKTKILLFILRGIQLVRFSIEVCVHMKVHLIILKDIQDGYQTNHTSSLLQVNHLSHCTLGPYQICTRGIQPANWTFLPAQNLNCTFSQACGLSTTCKHHPENNSDIPSNKQTNKSNFFMFINIKINTVAVSIKDECHN